MSKCNAALLFFNFKKNLFSIFVVSLIMFLVACTQHYQTLYMLVCRSVGRSVISLFLVVSQDSIRSCVHLSVGRSSGWSVGRSITLLSAYRDKTASDYCHVYELVYHFSVLLSTTF